VGKPDLKWSDEEEDEDFDAAFKYLSLLRPDTKAHALVTSLRSSKLIEHAAKDLWRAAQLPLLPRPSVQYPLLRHREVSWEFPAAVWGDMGLIDLHRDQRCRRIVAGGCGGSQRARVRCAILRC
jgi:hypothetical protein